MLTSVQIQEIMDEERGFLDRKHNQTPGWSGPITKAYMKGYGEQPKKEKLADIDAHVNHGWY